MCAFGKANVVHLAVNTLLDLRERIDLIACIRAACSSMIGNDDISDDDPYMKAGLLLVLLVVVAMQDTTYSAPCTVLQAYLDAFGFRGSC
jgi:hypothetical protein